MKQSEISSTTLFYRNNCDESLQECFERIFEGAVVEDECQVVIDGMRYDIVECQVANASDVFSDMDLYHLTLAEPAIAIFD